MILVTGSDGIVGRALCVALEASNMPFLPLSHRRKPHTLARALCVDLTHDISALTPFLDCLSGIVHLAAVPHSVEYPDNEESAELTRAMDQNISAIREPQVFHWSICQLAGFIIAVVVITNVKKIKAKLKFCPRISARRQMVNHFSWLKRAQQCFGWLRQ